MGKEGGVLRELEVSGKRGGEILFHITERKKICLQTGKRGRVNSPLSSGEWGSSRPLGVGGKCRETQKKGRENIYNQEKLNTSYQTEKLIQRTVKKRRGQGSWRRQSFGGATNERI